MRAQCSRVVAEFDPLAEPGRGRVRRVVQIDCGVIHYDHVVADVHRQFAAVDGDRRVNAVRYGVRVVVANLHRKRGVGVDRPRTTVEIELRHIDRRVGIDGVAGGGRIVAAAGHLPARENGISVDLERGARRNVDHAARFERQRRVHIVNAGAPVGPDVDRGAVGVAHNHSRAVDRGNGADIVDVEHALHPPRRRRVDRQVAAVDGERAVVTVVGDIVDHIGVDRQRRARIDGRRTDGVPVDLGDAPDNVGAIADRHRAGVQGAATGDAHCGAGPPRGSVDDQAAQIAVEVDRRVGDFDAGSFDEEGRGVGDVDGLRLDDQIAAVE